MTATGNLNFLLAVSLIGSVTAGAEDDFSNNLFSDLAPLLALFGERVTMQFMSQSMGWTDNIILAMAPLGIITAIFSAIRVGGSGSWDHSSARRSHLLWVRHLLPDIEVPEGRPSYRQLCISLHCDWDFSLGDWFACFNSYAIFANDDRTIIATSSRADRKNKSTGPIDILLLAIVSAVTKLNKFIALRKTKPNHDKKQDHATVLAIKAVLGTTISLCGFSVQFIGLRGMHWSASIAQLGIVLLMTCLRAWVRRGLAKPPQCKRFPPGFELEWFTTMLGDPEKAPWMATPNSKKQINSKIEREIVPNSEKEVIKQWRIVTGESFETHELGHPSKNDSSKAHTVMMIRRNIGKLADWRGPASTEAVTLARAIEITMDALFRTSSEDGFIWIFRARYNQSDPLPIYFRLRRRNSRWKAYADEIEAALSLWLYSVSKQEEQQEQEQVVPRTQPLHDEDISYPKVFNFTKLHQIAQSDDWWRIRGVLDKEEDANEKDIYDWTPLHYAAAKGSTDSARELLDGHRADVNARNLLEWTPLHYACQSGETSIIHNFLREGAELDVRCRDGIAPLHCAAMNGHLVVVRSLIEAGAVVDILDASGHTPLLWAAYKGHKDVVEYLWQDVNLKLRDQNGRTALHLAAIAGMAEVVELLDVKLKADKKAKDRNGRILLHFASGNGHLNVIALPAVELQVNKDAKDGDGWTPLHLAASNGHLDVVTLLAVELRVDKDAKADNGQTALHLAAKNGHLNIVTLLAVELGRRQEHHRWRGLDAAAPGHRKRPLVAH